MRSDRRRPSGSSVASVARWARPERRLRSTRVARTQPSAARKRKPARGSPLRTTAPERSRNTRRQGSAVVRARREPAATSSARSRAPAGAAWRASTASAMQSAAKERVVTPAHRSVPFGDGGARLHAPAGRRAPRAAPGAGGRAVRPPLIQRAIDGPHRPRGRHLQGAALPLLPEQAGLLRGHAAKGRGRDRPAHSTGRRRCLPPRRSREASTPFWAGWRRTRSPTAS